MELIKSKIVALSVMYSATHLHRNNLFQLYVTDKPTESTVSDDLHLYFTTDEEIKEGDWCLMDNNTYEGQHDTPSIINVIGFETKDGVKLVKTKEFTTSLDRCTKIVATTDRRLKLPTPTKRDLKAYTKVKVKDECYIEIERLILCEGSYDPYGFLIKYSNKDLGYQLKLNNKDKINIIW